MPTDPVVDQKLTAYAKRLVPAVEPVVLDDGNMWKLNVMTPELAQELCKAMEADGCNSAIPVGPNVLVLKKQMARITGEAAVGKKVDDAKRNEALEVAPTPEGIVDGLSILMQRLGHTPGHYKVHTGEIPNTYLIELNDLPKEGSYTVDNNPADIAKAADKMTIPATRQMRAQNVRRAIVDGTGDAFQKAFTIGNKVHADTAWPSPPDDSGTSAVAIAFDGDYTPKQVAEAIGDASMILRQPFQLGSALRAAFPKPAVGKT